MARCGDKLRDRDISNPVIAQFTLIAKELDDKNDRHERLVKLSRDITIESKRVIFLLHSIDLRKDNHDRVMSEAKDRLTKLCETKFQALAKELHTRDHMRHIRAFSAGLQEFVEAITFLDLCAGRPIAGWKDIIEKHLTYADAESWTCPLPPMEYMLGLQDTTGELMRKSINSLGSGDVNECTAVCEVLRALYVNYLSIGPTYNRECARKMSTLRQSLLKAEFVCYNIKVRGKEAAKWSAAQSGGMTHGKDSEDEGIA